MALSQTSKTKAGAHVLHEVDKQLSREEVVITGGSFEVAAVLGKVTASGKYTEFDPAAVDGSETAAAILFDAVDASAADESGVIHDCLTIVRESDLVWKAGVTEAEKTAALAALRTNNNIKAR